MHISYKIAFFFRFLSFLVISNIPFWFFPDFFSWYALPVVVFLAFFSGHLFIKTKLRITILFILSIVLCTLISAMFSLIVLIASAPFLHGLYLHFSLVFFPTSVFFVFTAISTVAFIRNRKWRCIEPFLLIIIFCLMFWTQDKYFLTIFSHSFHLAIFVFIFLVAITGTLLFSSDQGRAPFFILLILSSAYVAGGVSYMNIYNTHAVASTGGLIQPTLFRFDFSSFLTLQEEIKLNDKLVCIVNTPNEFSGNFLRHTYLSGWNSEQGFFETSVPGELEQHTSVPKTKKTLNFIPRLLRKNARQEIFIVNFDPNSLIAMDYPIEITPYSLWENSSFNGAYSVVSQVSEFVPFELFESSSPKKGTDISFEAFSFYTTIDDKTKLLLEPLVQNLTTNTGNYYEKISTLTSFLRNGEYSYSLKPGISTSGNQLEHFLFSSKKGYCTYFAFSLCLMLRTAGIPSRVAIGFFLNNESARLDYYPVRSNMAHAWVEVFFPKFGWISFDPTTTKIADGEDIPFIKNTENADFVSLLNEIFENKNLLAANSLSSKNTPEEVNVSLFSKEEFFFLSRCLITLIFTLLVLTIPFLRFREMFIIARSTNHRVVILLCAKIIKRRIGFTKQISRSYSFFQYAEKTNNPAILSIYSLEQKARFAPFCSEQDANDARNLLKGFRSSIFSSLFKKNLLCILLLVSFPFLAKAQETSQELLSQAEKAIYAENWDRAISTLSRGKFLYPQDPLFPFTLGKVFEKENLFAAAKNEFSSALNLGMKENPKLYELIASCHSYLNENEQALQYQRDYLNLVPDDLFGWSNFGWLCYKTNRLQEGIKALHFVLSRYGPDGNLYVSLGNLYTAEFDYANAKKYYTYAISIARENKDSLLGSIYLYNRSILEETFYNFDDAYKDTVSSINASSRSTGYLMQGELELRKLEFQNALVRYQKAYSLDSTPLAALGLADTLVQAGYVEEAQPFLDAIIRRTDMSWIANYGTTPDQFLADISRIQRNRYTVLKYREKRRVVHKLSTAIKKTINIIKYTGHLWYHNGRYSIYNKRVAQYYEQNAKSLYYNSFYYRAFTPWPKIARIYLSRARDIEVVTIPQAEAAYKFEIARITNNHRAYQEAIEALNPEWERNFIAKALSRYILLLQKKKLAISPQTIQSLFKLKPSSFLLHNLAFPVSLHIEGGSKKMNNTVFRCLKKAMFTIRENAACKISITISNEKVLLRCTNLDNSLVYTQVIHRGASFTADLIELINDFVYEIFRSPLNI